MELEFRNLVVGNGNFANTSLATFSALPELDIEIYFGPDQTPADAIFKARVLKLRTRYNSKGKCLYCSVLI